MGEFIGFSFVMLLVLAAYWSFVILPRQRMFRKHNKYVQTLTVGDEVITAGGLVGTLTRMEAAQGIAYVQIAEGVEVKVLTTALSRPFDAEEVAITANLGVDPTADQRLQQRSAQH
ncbi:MAG: preprotein translocase subunit YajC [Chloroflexi bacterium CFX4]|nr:preprotein translocase subunit YajC [Chloroflexi bacterium CFX4]MDL1922583.1 preprotein translocase subunit YajC [Chloroflexi bacterium CFX3]